jgi:hypothetical protein
MNKYTAQAEKEPALLVELWKLLSPMQRLFRQERVYRRVVALLFGELFALGRHTVTQLLRTLGAVDQDWSAWYRLLARRVNEDAWGRQLLRETLAHVPVTAPYVTTVDGVRIPRSGKRVAGSSWWPGQNTAPFDRGLVRGQRFVEVSWLTPEEDSYRRAIPLRWLPAPTEKAVPSEVAAGKEWQVGLTAWQWVRQELDAQGRSEQWLVGIADGSYDVQGIWQDLPPRTALVVRCARNRVLYALPVATETPRRRGRQRLYGPRQPAPWEWLRRRSQLRLLSMPIRGRERHLPYRVVGPVLVEGAPRQPLFLIVIGGRSKKVGTRRPRTYYRKPAYYLVNAVPDAAGEWQLPFPVEQLIEWAWQRWECEVAHREMKSVLGIGEKQCWSPQTSFHAVQWGVWVYGVCVLAAYRCWGLRKGPRRAGRWYRRAQRWSFAAMWQAYRVALWETAEFRPLYAVTLDKWLKKETWMTGLHNSLADPARI